MHLAMGQKFGSEPGVEIIFYLVNDRKKKVNKKSSCIVVKNVNVHIYVS